MLAAGAFDRHQSGLRRLASSRHIGQRPGIGKGEVRVAGPRTDPQVPQDRHGRSRHLQRVQIKGHCEHRASLDEGQVTSRQIMRVVGRLQHDLWLSARQTHRDDICVIEGASGWQSRKQDDLAAGQQAWPLIVVLAASHLLRGTAAGWHSHQPVSRGEHDGVIRSPIRAPLEVGAQDYHRFSAAQRYLLQLAIVVVVEPDPLTGG